MRIESAALMIAAAAHCNFAEIVNAAVPSV